MIRADHRESSRAQLRDALARVAVRSAPWRPWADIALWDAATRLAELTSDDVWIELHAHGVPDPIEPRAIGPVMLAAMARGWVRATDRHENADNPATSRNHGRPQRVYESLVYGYPPVPPEVWAVWDAPEPEPMPLGLWS